MRDKIVPLRFEKGAKGYLKVPNSNSCFVIGKFYATYQKINDTLKVTKTSLVKMKICQS